MSTVSDSIIQADVANAKAAGGVREVVEKLIELRRVAESLPADERAKLKAQPSVFTSILASIDSTLGGYLALEITYEDFVGESIFPTEYTGVVISRRLVDASVNDYALDIAVDDTPEITGNPYFEAVIEGSMIPCPAGEDSAANSLLGRRVRVNVGDYHSTDSNRRVINSIELI